MTITKIVSGGQTGADRAALDAAMELGIHHGGWVPRGRVAEDGVLPKKYNLDEMPSDSYSKRTEQNVLDSDGTVIVSHGPLTGGSKHTRDMAEKHARPYLHLDLNQTPRFKSAVDLCSWIRANRIEVLNVAGPRATEDPAIYEHVKGIVKGVFFLELAHNNKKVEPEDLKGPIEWPLTVDDGVQVLISRMALKDRVIIANMTYDELKALKTNVGLYIRNNFGIGNRENIELLQSCRQVNGMAWRHEESAVMVIIEALWEMLKSTHCLRAVGPPSKRIDPVS